ncbi:MAG: hypothetical protein ACRD3V_01055 [Vicinamibacteria bacterium]
MSAVKPRIEAVAAKGQSRVSIDLARVAEWGVLLLAGLALAFRIAVSGALPAGALRTICWITFAVSVLVLLLPGRRRWLDAHRVVLLAIGLWSLPSVYGRVGGDGIEYFVQARSLVFDRDLDFENDYELLGAPPIISAQGQITSRMPFGTALLWAPSLALTHAGASLASGFGADVLTNGASPLYQTAATTTSFLLGFLALIFLEKTLRLRYGAATALLVTAGAWLATPLHFYMVANPFMSHAASVFTATLFVINWLEAREGESLRPWAVAGGWAGLMMLVRPQDGVLLLIPVVDLLFSRKDLVRRIAALSVGPMACGLLQVLIWLAMYGSRFTYVVMSHGRLAATSPQIVGLLLSPRHGLLTWTPIFFASLAGWLLLARRSQSIALGIWLAFAMAVFLNSTNQDWWGSDSFGQRRMLGMLPLFAWGLAETFDVLRRRPMVLLSTAVVLLIAWNLRFAHIYNSMMVGTRNDALTLDRVAEAQVELSYRQLVEWHSWMPSALWVVLYDNLKGVWLDDGARSLKGMVDLGEEPEGYFPLVGDGWFKPEFEGRTSFRRSRTRRSRLTVPLREGKDCIVEVRARSEVESDAVDARLHVNGTNVGSVRLTEGWTVYSFEVSKSVLRPGLNELAFVYSDTPRTLDRSFRGKNAVWSVDWVRFLPRPGTGSR